MGYCITQRDCSFVIKKENIDTAYQSVQKMPNKQYSWVNEKWKQNCKTLDDVLEEWRYMPEHNEAGDIVSLQFEGEKLGDEQELFNALAPFVEKDSFIEMYGEDGYMWRWSFTNGKCLEISATISW